MFYPESSDNIDEKCIFSLRSSLKHVSLIEFLQLWKTCVIGLAINYPTHARSGPSVIGSNSNNEELCAIFELGVGAINCKDPAACVVTYLNKQT